LGRFLLEILGNKLEVISEQLLNQKEHAHNKAHPARTDRLIDFIVYRLHGLTEGEAAVGEGQD